MEIDVENITEPSTRNDIMEANLEAVAQVIIDQSNLSDTLSSDSCSKLAPELTSAELAPLQAATSHSVTADEVTSELHNIDMDETLCNAAYPVYVKSLTEAEDVLHRFENDTKTRFSVWRCPKDFGNSQIGLANKRIYWQEFDIGDKITVKSDGVPFIMMGRKVYDCHFGKDRNVKLKEKMRLQREEELKNDNTKARKTPLTRKLDCPAKIILCEIIYFPEFKISNNTKYFRGVVAKKIKEGFSAGSVNLSNIERRIYISFPTSDEHTGHPTTVQGTSNNSSHRMDPKLSKKLSELVLSGVRNEKEMKRQLEIYINRELYPGKARPFHTNKRYFPNMGVIRNKMYHECVLQRLMVLDSSQVDELVARVPEASPNDKVYSRSFDGMDEVLSQGTVSISVEELLDDEIRVRQKFAQQQFIFVHQTSFQRHLLSRYGNHVCFLDPVYRTVKYPLPLFFLMVKTNIDYQAVATFVVHDENKESTKEALDHIKAWNPEWKPKVFMVDNDIEEIAALEECFIDCKVFLSDFFREQAWQHWLSQSSNGVVAHRSAILAYLRRVAEAKTVLEYEEALQSLKQTEWWKCDYGKTFRHWFEEKWLSIKERWVYAFQKSWLCDLVMTNNTVERQKKDFSHDQLLNESGTLLSDVLGMVIDTILPAKRSFYMEQNAPTSHKDINNLPIFYRNRPRDLAQHTAECMTSVNEYTSDDIVLNSVARGEFFVKSSHSDAEYKVHFGNDIELPHCECEDWFKTMMPCKHFLVVMHRFENWNWSSFPKSYRNSPYFTLDPTVERNLTEEVTMESRSDPSGIQESLSIKSQEIPSESREGAISNRQGPSGSRPYPSGNRQDPSGSQDDESRIPSVSLYEVLFERKSELKSTACECRDLLNDINNMTYLIQDKKVLTTLHGMLQETLHTLRRSMVDDDVVFGPSSEAMKSDDEKSKVYSVKDRKRVGDLNGEASTSCKSLKVDQSSENSVQGSVGGINPGHYETVNGSALTSGVVNSNMGTSAVMKSNGGTSEGMNGDIGVPGDVRDNVDMDIETSEGGRVDNWGFTHPGTMNGGDPQGLTENPNDPAQMNMSDSENSGLNFSELGDTKEDDVTVLYSNPAGSLSKYEERLLTRQEVVTHTTVNLAQDFLKEAFPHVGGLQNVASGPLQAFEHVSGDFIQILHDGFNHWVCLSSIGVDIIKHPTTVTVYDSMNEGFIAKFTKQQLASFTCIQSAEMKVILKSVQQHTSSVDCGVFAIAFATALAFGLDPSKLRFDVPKMRAHLVECLKLKKMSPFPEIKPGSGLDEIILSKRKFYTVELFCSCRMPYEKPKSEADLMAQCGSCKEWFHQRCDSLKQSGHSFVCRLCLTKV